MKAILIDVHNKDIKEIDYDGNIKNLYKFVDCQLFDIVNIDDSNHIFVDDEGLFVANQLYFSYNDKALAGNGLILGYNRAGETTGTTLDIKDVTANIKWLPKGYAVEPEIKVTAWRL